MTTLSLNTGNVEAFIHKEISWKLVSIYLASINNEIQVIIDTDFGTSFQKYKNFGSAEREFLFQVGKYYTYAMQHEMVVGKVSDSTEDMIETLFKKA